MNLSSHGAALSLAAALQSEREDLDVQIPHQGSIHEI